MESKSMKIEGMTCSACANRVEKVVSKLDGINKASVNFATETLSVEYETGKVTEQNIQEAVEKAGYKIHKNMKTYTVDVKGMTCSACANRIEKVTGKILGVEN